jgi:serine/threonine-protein kinase ATR
MDHLSSWVRAAQDSVSTKREGKRPRVIDIEQEDQMARIDSVLTSVDEGLVADAAYECKAYPRALMSLENHIRIKRERKTEERDLQVLYDRLHLIYCHMDEPDGMEGVSIQVLEPSLEHQIRHHESIGSWMSAQSCWEVRLQGEPDKIDYHLGLLQCLRNLGHYGMLLPPSNQTS